jgi:precorrin-4/cobalt-precorrin-4 C11-methyltransferase
VQHIERLVEELAPNYGLDCPAAVVARASRDDELILRGTLATIAEQVREADVRRTAVVIVGQVLAAGNFPDSHLYSTTRAR